MEKNQIIGFTLISTILIGYMFWQESYGPKPLPAPQEQVTTSEKTIEASVKDSSITTIDSVSQSVEEKTTTIETDVLKITFSNIGADIQSAILKDHKDLYDQDLELIDQSNFSFNVGLGKVNTKDIPFQTEVGNTTITGEESTTLKFISTNAIITYTIKGNSYLLDYNIQAPGISDIKTYAINWVSDMKRVELGIDESLNNSTINYYTSNEDFDNVGTGKGTEDEDIKEPLKWFSIKQRFFNIGFIAEKQFTDAKFKTIGKEGDSSYFKLATADLTVNVNGAVNDNYSMYIGPNDYKIVKTITDGYHENVDLGWGIFGWINKFMVIPIFKFLEQHISNYGLIILALVIIIKLLLFPIAYRSYVSMAKMKVLKPELDEMKERVGDDTQKQQQEQMKIYQQVGVNPVSGCIPMVLQMPFLFAMFRFFPNSIELRHESFLWANDLSTYDAPIHWGTYIWPIGDHISLFCVLMTITSLVYAWYNNQMNPGAAPGPMKNIGYIMPVMFFFILNSFSSGLTFYYFVSTLITILQQQGANAFIDKDKIRAQLDENRKNAGTKKKSGFRARIEEAMKAAQEQQAKNKKK